jgi:hypothetical protein
MTNLVTVSVLTDTLNETSFTTHLPEEHIPDDSWPRLTQQLKYFFFAQIIRKQ